jgi:hypothetical protein
VNQQGRSADDEKALRTALTESRVVQTRVAVLDMSGEQVDDLTDQFVDGQSNVHAGRKVSRSLQIEFANPGQVLPRDADSPAPGALGFTRMLQVSYDVLIDDEFVETDVFTGPITHMRRRAGLAYVEAHGKESLALHPAMEPLTLTQGMAKTDAIREILSQRAGETQFDIPDLPAKLPHDLSLGRETRPWRIAQRLAAGMGMQLFYNGSGVCVLRDVPTTPLFTFTDDAHVKPPGPRISFTGDIVNSVYVFGAPPLGGKTQVAWRAVAPADHPLSPFGDLAVNGVPSWRTRFIHDDTIRTQAEAKAVAERELADALVQHTLIRFEATPCAFFLDPLDMCEIDSDVQMPFRLHRYSFPLAADPSARPMTVGYLDDLLTDRSARR